MNSVAAVLSIILGIVVFGTVVGLIAGKRGAPNLEEWAVGGRGFGAVLVWLLLAGEIFTTFSFLGLSGWAYARGGPVLYSLVYLTLGQVIFFYLGPRIWEEGRRHGLQTLPDFFARRYGGRLLQVMVGIFGILFLVLYVQLQLTGLGIIVGVASYEHIDRTPAMIVATVLIAGFVFTSGIRGVAWVSIVKDVFLTGVAVVIGIGLPYHYFGGIGSMFAALNRAKPGFLTMPGGTPNLGHAWFVSSVLLSSLTYCWPHTFGSLFTAKSAETVRKNTIYLPLYILALFLILFAGFTAVLVVPGLKNGDLGLLTAVRQTFPPWFLGIVGGAGALTAMVPAAVIVLTASTLFAKNVWRPIRGSEMSERSLARLARATVMVVLLLALYLALHSSTTLVSLLLLAYSGVGQFFPGILLGLCWKRVTGKGVVAGIVGGIGLAGILVATGHDPVWGLNAGFVALAVNFALAIGTSWMTRPEPDGLA